MRILSRNGVKEDSNEATGGREEPSGKEGRKDSGSERDKVKQ